MDTFLVPLPATTSGSAPENKQFYFLFVQDCVACNDLSLCKSVNPDYERQNPKMKLREVCPLSLANRKALRMTEFSRHLLYRHSSHNREFHNINCRFFGAIHDVDWACINVLSQVIRNVNERKTVQTNIIFFVSYGDKTL